MSYKNVLSTIADSIILATVGKCTINNVSCSIKCSNDMYNSICAELSELMNLEPTLLGKPDYVNIFNIRCSIQVEDINNVIIELNDSIYGIIGTITLNKSIFTN